MKATAWPLMPVPPLIIRSSLIPAASPPLTDDCRQCASKAKLPQKLEWAHFDFGFGCSTGRLAKAVDDWVRTIRVDKVRYTML